MDRLRRMSLKKRPSISEALDWAAALVSLSVDNLSEEALEQTLSVLLKYERDLDRAREKMLELKQAAL